MRIIQTEENWPQIIVNRNRKYIALLGDLIFYKYIIDYQPSNIINIYICD